MMSFCEIICDGISVPLGNSANAYKAVLDFCGDEAAAMRIYTEISAFECNAIKDPAEAKKMIRKAFECIGYFCGALRKGTSDKSIDEKIEDDIAHVTECIANNAPYTRPAIRIKKYLSLKYPVFPDLGFTAFTLAAEPEEAPSSIGERYLREYYHRISSSIHYGEVDDAQDSKDYTAYATDLFHLLSLVLEDPSLKYDTSLNPIGSYYVVPKNAIKKMGLRLPPDCGIYIGKDGPVWKWYMIKRIRGEYRKIDVNTGRILHDQKGFPYALRDQEMIETGRDVYQVYRLPGKPYPLDPSLLNEEEKEQIGSQLIECVLTLQDMHYYHRGLNCDSFYLFRDDAGWKTKLINMESMKFDIEDTKMSRHFTHEHIDQIRRLAYVDPSMEKEISKSDIYSLGKLLIYLYTGDPNAPDTESIPEYLQDDIARMIREDPADRPAIRDILCHYQHRPSNQDIAWMVKTGDGIKQTARCLVLQSGDIAKDPVVLAVFDGLDESHHGFEASVAAYQYSSYFLKRFKISELHVDPKEYLDKYITWLEKQMREYAEKHDCARFGCSIACCLIMEDTIFSVHLGDTGVYLMRRSGMQALTKPHIMKIGGGILWQYLGASVSGSGISPEFHMAQYGIDDKILICTGGMMDDVWEILSAERTAGSAVNSLREACHKKAAAILMGWKHV